MYCYMVTLQAGRTGAMWVWFVGCFLLLFHLCQKKTKNEILSTLIAAPQAFLAVLLFYRFSIAAYMSDFRFFVDLCAENARWLILGLLFLATEFATYWKLSSRIKGEVYRHLAHLFGSLLIAYFIWVSADLAFIFLCFYIAAFSIGTYLRHAPLYGERMKTLQRLINQWLEAGERTAEEQKLFTAAYFGMIGMMIPLLLLEREKALASALALAVGDPTATMVGLKFGEHKWRHNPNKSVEGSVAMCLVLSAILLCFSSPLAAFIIALSVSLFESMPLMMSDNLLVPIFCGTMLTVIGK